MNGGEIVGGPVKNQRPTGYTPRSRGVRTDVGGGIITTKWEYCRLYPLAPSVEGPGGCIVVCDYREGGLAGERIPIGAPSLDLEITTAEDIQLMGQLQTINDQVVRLGREGWEAIQVDQPALRWVFKHPIAE